MLQYFFTKYWYCYGILFVIALLISRLHDTTVYTLYNRFDNRLYRVKKHPTGCQIGLTTVLNEQPLFVQPVIKPGCTTGFTTGCIHDTVGCQTGFTTGCIV